MPHSSRLRSIISDDPFTLTGEVADLFQGHRIGECVSPGDVKAFTDAILKLYHDRSLCEEYGERGHQALKERFSTARLSGELERQVLVKL